ncbi:MAG TPA: putative molybdenum carrier protein [Gammaproteobacteria bacterium]|nr:putative molybdenum carrier protein [Gammaproteobacteria bacterium]
MLKKIISGGQTGVDQAALDVAIKLNIPHGGWCPKGRKTEYNKPMDACYKLHETDSDDPNVRTKLNIRDSDGTLILVPSIPVKVSDGTIVTINEVIKKKKPHLIIDVSENNVDLPKKIIDWIKENNIKILNVAGPRESQSLGIYVKSSKLLTITLCRVVIKENICEISQIKPKL